VTRHVLIPTGHILFPPVTLMGLLAALLFLSAAALFLLLLALPLLPLPLFGGPAGVLSVLIRHFDYPRAVPKAVNAVPAKPVP
jgi:hypothetical protein